MEKQDKTEILIIDDNPDDLRIFGKYLQEAGFIVKTALSSQEGIEMLSKEKIECILLDYRMPKQDGIETVKRLKTDSHFKFIPVIILTGLEAEESVIKGLDAGANDYVAKSSSPKTIVARINALLRMKQLQDEIKIVNEKLKKTNEELKLANDAKTSLISQLDKAIWELKELSIKDSLTRLYNHGYFQEALDGEILRAKRYNHNLCCLMIDIDYFKVINDNYGHTFGDLVLKELAMDMRKCFREADILVRYGGEEFVVLVSDTDYEGAITAAERFRQSIETCEFRDKDILVRLTVSIGISSLLEDNIFAKDRLLSFADRALYEAKLRGRNNTVTYKEIAEDMETTVKFTELRDRIYGISENAKKNYIESIKTLVIALEEKDPFTREHSINVLRYSSLIAKELCLAQNEIEIIENASILHDLGKLLLSDAVLSKEEPLTEEEWVAIKSHPSLSARLMQKSGYMRREIPLILFHHERYDGKGYPTGLKGESIPLGARIIAVADSYDSMRVGRIYRSPLPSEKIIDELVNCSGKQFDPEVVKTFLIALNKNGLLPPEIKLEEKLEKLSSLLK